MPIVEEHLQLVQIRIQMIWIPGIIFKKNCHRGKSLGSNLKLYTKYIFESIHAIPWTVIFQFQPKLDSAKYAILIQKVHTCRIYSRLTTCLMQNNSITQGKVVQGIRYSKQVYKYIWDSNYFEDVVYIQKMQIIHIFNNVQEKNLVFCIWLIHKQLRNYNNLDFCEWKIHCISYNVVIFDDMINTSSLSVYSSR